MPLSTAPLIHIEDQIAHFWQEVSDAVAEELTRIVIGAYASSLNFAQGRYGERYRGRAVRGHVRRDDIECELLKLRVYFPDQVMVEEQTNRTRSSEHVEIRIRLVVLTVSKTLTRGAPLKKALFREPLARSPQLRLPFSNIELPPPPVSGTALWAAVIHGCAHAHADRPDFVRVVFPNEEGRHEGGIDLLMKYEHLLTRPSGIGMEIIDADKGQPRLKAVPRHDAEEERA